MQMPESKVPAHRTAVEINALLVKNIQKEFENVHSEYTDAILHGKFRTLNPAIVKQFEEKLAKINFAKNPTCKDFVELKEELVKLKSQATSTEFNALLTKFINVINNMTITVNRGFIKNIENLIWGILQNLIKNFKEPDSIGNNKLLDKAKACKQKYNGSLAWLFELLHQVQCGQANSIPEASTNIDLLITAVPALKDLVKDESLLNETISRLRSFKDLLKDKDTYTLPEDKIKELVIEDYNNQPFKHAVDSVIDQLSRFCIALEQWNNTVVRLSNRFLSLTEAKQIIDKIVTDYPYNDVFKEAQQIINEEFKKAGVNLDVTIVQLKQPAPVAKQVLFKPEPKAPHKPASPIKYLPDGKDDKNRRHP